MIVTFGMNISLILKQLSSAKIPLFTLIVLIVIAAGIILFLVSFIIYLYKKVRFLAHQRYGFGGRPLFSYFAILGITLLMTLTFYLSYRSYNIIRQARVEKDVIVDIRIVKRVENDYLVTFIAVPEINSESWSNKSYSVKWEVTGNEKIELLEEDRSIYNPSFAVFHLTQGVYTVKVTVDSEDFHIVKTMQFEVKE